MSEQERVEEKLSAAEFRERLDELLERAGNGDLRIVVEQDGAPAAAVISAQDLEWLKFFEKKWDEQFKVLDEVWAKNQDLSEEELEREVERSIAEVRAENRRQEQQNAQSA